MFELEGKILDFTAGKFTNDQGEVIVYSSAVVQTDSGVVNLNVADGLDLKPFKGKEVTLDCELYGSVKKTAKPRIVSAR